MTRGGILASGAAVALIAAGAIYLSADAHAQAQGQSRAARDSRAMLRRGHGSAMPAGRRAMNGKWNTLAKLSSPPAPNAPRKLAGPITGDAAKGAKLVADRNRGGSCLACHVMGPAGGADLPGNVGPDLSEIGSAGRDGRVAVQLHLRRARL